MTAPAPWPKAVLTQVRMEVRLTARRGENLLAMVGVPIVALLFFGTVVSGPSSVGQLLPGALAIALVASGLVNLGIATAYERGYGVLKRLGGSPLGGSGLVAAKLAVVGLIAVAQVAGLVAVAALAMGWRPDAGASLPAIAVTTIVGAVTFAGLGLALAGTLRPEAALVLANVLFLVAIAFGGAIVPIGDLPSPVADVVRFSPVGALADTYAAALGNGTPIAAPFGILLFWAVLADVFAARTFRWD